jgi:hypothetical protein
VPEIPDLWPKEIGAESSVVTPLAVLRTAAAQLGERTQQLIVGDVEQGLYGNDKFRLNFYIEVPSLDHYRFKLFTVEHDIDSFYPATGRVASPSIARPEVDLPSEEELQDWLKHVFASPRTTKLVNTLLQQLRS